MNRVIVTILYITLSIAAHAVSPHAIAQYILPRNKFGTLLAGQHTVQGVDVGIIKNQLTINNTTTSDYFLVDTTSLPTNYRYSILLANANNLHGRTVKITDNNGRKHKTKTMRWGVVCDIQPNGDKIVVELKCENNDFYEDLNDNRAISLSVIKYRAGEPQIIETVKVDKNVNLFDGNNVLTVATFDNNMRILVGRRKPHIVFEREIGRSSGNFHAGVFAGPGSCVKLSRGLLSYKPDTRMIIPTQWDKESLEQYLAQSTDPMEGMWQYLDRDMEEKRARMGGRYMLATVRNQEGIYDILYCSGAQVNDILWQPHMLKGKLKKTIFAGNYDAMWIDSTFEPHLEDIQATIENGVILAIKFPVLKSQLRFSKVLNIY